MNIFISWSGERSKEIAKGLCSWLQDVIQELKPWVSCIDIDAGKEWRKELENELLKCDLGILCITPENMNSPWLIFEAGALYHKENLKLIPILFKLEPGQIAPPLSDLQCVSADKDGFENLVLSIAKDTLLTEEGAKKQFNKWWIDMAELLKKIPPQHLDFTTHHDWRQWPKKNKMITLQQNQQIKQCKLILTKDNYSKITIHELKDPIDNKKLNLSWETFGKGVMHLQDSLRNKTSIHPDIIFGINEAGIMIASYLCHEDKVKNFGYFFMGSKIRGIRPVVKSYLPEWDGHESPLILLVDSEIKSGITGKTAIKLIKDNDNYNSPEVIYICLGGVVRNKEDITSVKNFGWELEKDDEEYMPDLLAYYISEPGFEPPGTIR